MNITLRDALAEQIDQIAPAQLNTNELVDLGERRVHRHRLTAVLGSAAAVILVIILAVGGAALHRSADPGPTNTPHPDRRHTDEQVTQPDGTNGQTRQVVYSESQLFAHKTGTIHFGDRSVETGDGFVHIDVTDDGFIYTSEGRVWFSDGGTPVQIASHPCGASRSGEFSNFANRSVMTANAGSLAAWFDCEAARPTLVVYDTASRSEIARRPIALCRRWCELVDVTPDHVYVNVGVYAGYPQPEYAFDVTTHQLRASSRQVYAGDLISHPRGLVIGDTWQTGTATNGIGQDFSVVGSRLVPLWELRKGVLTHSYDTASRHEVRLRLPVGYDRYPNESFVLFEWLDDDTVALAGGGSGDGVGDILTCHLSSGRCDLTVKRADGQGAGYRILPNLPLPG